MARNSNENPTGNITEFYSRKKSIFAATQALNVHPRDSLSSDLPKIFTWVGNNYFENGPMTGIAWTLNYRVEQMRNSLPSKNSYRRKCVRQRRMSDFSKLMLSGIVATYACSPDKNPFWQFIASVNIKSGIWWIAAFKVAKLLHKLFPQLPLTLSESRRK